jgi:hypothetical protein
MTGTDPTKFPCSFDSIIWRTFEVDVTNLMAVAELAGDVTKMLAERPREELADFPGMPRKFAYLRFPSRIARMEAALEAAVMKNLPQEFVAALSAIAKAAREANRLAPRPTRQPDAEPPTNTPRAEPLTLAQIGSPTWMRDSEYSGPDLSDI